MTRLRTLLEKSEAARHQADYTILVEQKKCRELKDEVNEQDIKTAEEIGKYKGWHFTK